MVRSVQLQIWGVLPGEWPGPDAGRQADGAFVTVGTISSGEQKGVRGEGLIQGFCAWGFCAGLSSGLGDLGFLL